MKVLVADKIAPSGVDYLRKQPDIEVVEAYGSSPEKILELVADVDAVIVRSETKITREVMEAAPSLKAVGRAGVGVDNIDVEAATSRGIIVMNTPGGNTVATAELTFTHLLCGARPVPQACASMREGKWDRKAFSGTELFRKTIGICGVGRIGGEVARRAQAFGMKVLAYDPYLAPSRAKTLDIEPVDLDTLVREADYITVHMPKTERTSNLIDAAAFAKMKDGVRIFNCARGGLIQESALLEALKSGKVAAAGLDVYEKEPLPEDSEFRKLPNVVLTPHLGASTQEAQENVGVEVAESILEAIAGGVIMNAVNMPSVDKKTLQALKPYLDLATKLGTVVQQISPESIEKLKVTYWGKLVELDANPVTRSIMFGYLQQISGENVNHVNAPVLIKSLGIEVDVTKSNVESDYTELIQLEATNGSGKTYSVSGTLIGKNFMPRIVEINGRDVEATPEGTLLLLENQDVPGMVGTLGQILGRENVNIAAMSLSRNEVGGRALTVLALDSEPGRETLDEISAHEAISNVMLVKA